MSTPLWGKVRFRTRNAFCDACGCVVLTIKEPDWSGVSTSLMESQPLLPQLFSQGFTGLSYQQTNKQKTINSMWRPLWSSQVAKSDCGLQVPCLNTTVLFPFGGETRFIHFPLFIDNSTCNLCRFFVVLRRMNSFNPIWERQEVFLRNDILVKLANDFGPNPKIKVKTQTLLCFLAEKSNQRESDCLDSLFKMLKANLRKNRNNPENR